MKRHRSRLLGIMQGRLVPPTDGRFQSFPIHRWADEFSLARQAGLDCIEWIYDAFGAQVNPLATAEGSRAMQALGREHGVQVVSLCADYFMDLPLVRCSPADLEQRLATLAWLLRRAGDAGIRHLVIPFVDASRIDTDDELNSVAASLRHVLPVAESAQVEIHLETSLAPRRFAQLLEKVPHPLVKVNYDSGNSASLGYRPQDEFAAYGPRVGSVHLKDRIVGGGTVPWGAGAADFTALFVELRKAAYPGNFILQIAREADGNEVNWAKGNAARAATLLETLE